MVVSTNLVLSVNCRTKDCVLSVTSTLSFERIKLGHGLVIQIFSIDYKNDFVRLAIPSQFGLP
jgi:hypothetical protein